MAVRKNGYYADPALGTAFDNLASAFATPSGTDIHGYANAAATREKAARLADLYAYAKDPGYKQELADRMGVAAGNYAPSQSYYAVDENNDTTLKTNADTNKTTLAKAFMDNKAMEDRQALNPIILKQGETSTQPLRLQQLAGLPPTLSGAFATAPGETITKDGVMVAAGTPKPLTHSEMLAKITGEQPKDDQRAVALQGVGISPIVGKDGEPVNVLTPNAVGSKPYIDDKRQPQIANFKTPDGRVGTASLDKETGVWRETQGDKQPLPPGTQTYTANLQGGKDETGLGSTAKNNIDQQLVDLTLAGSTSKQLRDIVSKNPAVQGLAGHIRGTVQDVVQAGGEVGQLFNVNMEKMKSDIAAGRVDPEVVKKFNFDPNIPATAMLETMLTAQVAKILDPNGRISNDRYEQVSKALGAGGWTGNTAKTLATLDQLDKVIADRRGILSPVRPAAAAIGHPAAGATPAIRTYNPATGALE